MKSRSQSGFSLVELLLIIATIGFLGLLVANLPSAMSSITKSRHASVAREIASKQIENLRKQSYENLLNSTNTFTDSNLSNLPGGSANYQIADCPEAVCTLDENAKEIKVTVAWVESGENKSVELTTMISEGGLVQ